MVKIAINAGHGINTPGKRVLKSLDPKETREWTLNARIVEKVLERLKAYEGYQILRTDDPTGRRDIPLAERTNSANNWGADIWLGIHHNAGINGGTGGGIVVYRQPNSQAKSTEYQKKVYDALIKHTGLRGNRATPMATANLHETRETRMPALLLELGFMDSRTDVPIILSEKFADQCADALVEFLVSEFKLKKKPAPQPAPPKDTVLPDGKFFRVVVGSYQSRNNATEMQDRLKKAGFDSFLVIFEK